VDERQVTGVVRVQLPSGLYEVEVDGAPQGTPSRRSGRRVITAHVGGGIERNFVRLIVGDRVTVELTPRDLTRGRIVRRVS
jgi:translation initiation factor IF-1